jgi:serine/threonine-protein kinase SRPK3
MLFKRNPWFMAGMVANIHKLWDILEDKKLFGDTYSVVTDDYDEVGHLAHITALLGPPPKKLLDRGKRTHLFYKPEG